MKVQTGIWIDTQQAVIVTLHDKEEHSREVLESGISSRERVPGETKDFGRFGDQYLDPEHKKEHRLEQQKKDYFKALAERVKGTAELVLFGPAGMKIAFEKYIRENRTLADKLLAVETTDSMTENQIAAWVKDFYRL